jgi:Peptidase family M28
MAATQPAPSPGAHQPQAGLRETVEALVAIERPPNSPGEREAAEWIAARLERAGCSARIEEERSYESYARPLAGLSALGAAAGMAALGRRGRSAAAVLAGAIAAAMADDISNGPRLFRRVTMRQKPTWNVVAQTGDADGERTLVLLAHHDAAPTGLAFDQSFQRWLAEAFPGIVERVDTALPQWWPVVASPALVALGAATGRRGLAVAGLAGCALATAAFADIARSPVTPGANDNLSGVACLVAVAHSLRDEPVSGLRLLLVSCGSEETLQGGIRGFSARHFPELDRDRTWVLNLDTVGSPELILLEGEGPLIMEDYHARSFRDLVARSAERAGVPLRRGMRARSSTDSVIPSRAGYPTATLASMNRHKALSNYHQMTDTPENLDYATVARAVAVAREVIRELAAEG